MATPVSPKVVHPELSYRIIGTAFKVFNNIGYGFGERHYQRAFANALAAVAIPFTKEQLVTTRYEGQPLGRYFLDFVVDDKIVVELKVRPRLGYTHVKQTMSYLKSTGYQLAILIYFTRQGVKYRRIVNLA